MAEHFATREGMIEVIHQNLLLGNHKDAEIILDAINDYKAQFAYKCTYTWCNDRKKNTLAKWSQPGFPSLQNLEDHRLTHPYHGLYNVRYSIMGTPWYECECNHTDRLNDEELELEFEGRFFGVPQSRLDHLEKVALVNRV
jgi:hypothetical protein